ncbi:MAG: DUF4115 domain-containing protein [Acidimicrobiales bacterium]|nr:DUF4115 domain-containing protein [Acidimicrobiales bacterium]
MWIVVGVVVLIAVVAFVATFIRRPRGDDLNSVRNYHSALGTLEHLSERTSQQSVNITGPAEVLADSHVRPRFYSRSGAEGDLRPPVPPGTTTSVPPVPVRGTDEFPDPETPLVFDDARPRDRYRERPSRDAPLSRTDRIQRHALDSMNHRPRRWATVSIVIAAVVLFGVLAYVGSRRSPSRSHAHSVSATSSTAAAVSHSGSTTGPKGKTKSTTTTAPAQVVALSSTSSTAVYPVSSAAYRLTVTTTGPCWVSATTAMTGSTLWAGTLQAGATQEIQASGIVRVQLGTTAASLALNGVPVVLPTPLRSPFEATFEPSTATSSSGGAASTTGTTGATGTTSTTSAP